jgi:hypothetical protein
MPVYSVLNRQLMRVGQPREGGFEPAFIEVGEFGRVHFIPDNPCQCRPFTDVKERGSRGELINMLVHGTINRFLERFGDLDRVRTFISVVAVMSIDGSLICIGPECVCRSLHDFVRRNPELSNKVLIEVRFLDDRKYDLGSREDLARLRLLAAEFCAMEGGNTDAFVETVIDYMAMIAASNEELRSEIDGWLKNPNKLPTNTVKELTEVLGMHKYSVFNLVKHIYLFWRPQLQVRLNTLSNEFNKGDGGQGPLQERVMNEATQQMAKAEATVKYDNEGEKAGNDIERQLGAQETAQGSRCGRDDAPLCNDKVKSGLIYDILSALDILGGRFGDVGDCDIATLLCEFAKDELIVVKDRVKGLSDGERAEARRLIIDWALGRVSDNDLRVFFGLETKPVEPEPVNIKEARESLVRELEGLRDAGRYAKATRGARSELSRIIFEVLRANMPRKDPSTLQLIASTLADLMLERPGVLMDIVHVETRCRDLGITCGGLWGAVKGVVDHVVEAVRHAKEFGNKKLRGDVLAEEVRAVTGEMVSETCLGIEEIKDALLDVVHNAILDKNLANTVRELLGKAVVTRCGAF